VRSNLNAAADLVKTLRAERAAQRSSAVTASSPETYGRMRRVLSWHPSVGRVIAKAAHSSSPRQQRDQTRPPNVHSNFLQRDEVGEALIALRSDGYYVFRNQVAPRLVQDLRDFALVAPCSARPATGVEAAYPGSQASAGRYDFSEAAILTSPAAQDWATDPLMRHLASMYLGLPVVLDLVAMWWTTGADPDERDGNAQLFHTDRDRLAFVKFFIYLTDVNGDSGPHVYVPGSHKRAPRSLQSDRRFTDDEVTLTIERGRSHLRAPVEIEGSSGTVFVADTRGLHKGKSPTIGDRLVLQSEFSSSLLGAAFERPRVLPVGIAAERLATEATAYRRWVISDA
jgi:hypothetical protein